MNTPAHWLSLYSAVMHLTMGLVELLRIGPRFLPPSWALIYMLVPGGEWLYPSAFVATGVIAAFGIREPAALRVACRMSAFLFLAWGGVGFWAYLQGVGGNFQGPAANLFIAGAMWVLAYYVSIGVQGDQVNRQLVRLAEQIDKEQGAVDA